MGNKDSPELTLCFLLMTALCFEAVTIEKVLYFSSESLSWEEARLYCQQNHIDLVTWNTVDRFWLAYLLKEFKVQQIWIGLHRDSEDDSAWKWINLKTGKGISGDNVSQTINWDGGQQSEHCAFVSETDQMWYSNRCSSEYNFYCSVGNTIQYHKHTLSWYNAFQYCQGNMSDLATITKNNTNSFKKTGWIGLYRKGGETWSWTGVLSSDYRNWAPKQPLNLDCASFDPVTQKCRSSECSEKSQFACSDDNLVLVKENKTWEDALNHCQSIETPCSGVSGPCTYQHKLLSLEQLSDYNYVRDRIYRATTDEVWIGLRFLGGEWWWMNGKKLEDHEILPGCPSQWKHCGTLSKHDTNNWIIRDCSERRNFICYRYKAGYV
uniref:macrophage mannose receptor 1-like n=1 Tax=Scatophagus argus TaxID=75038 RepID=UPI001ED85A1D|nr:macrophage mannose receptor 1-like [Scatophagus argus]